MIARIIRLICIWLSTKLPSITIPTSDKKPYLTRYYCFWADRIFGNIYLHHFHSSDTDIAPSGEFYFHSHPWPWSVSIILVGGYKEIRLVWNNDLKKYGFYEKIYRFGNLNFLNDKIFHRVELLENDAWSLFFTGWRSKNRNWGFMDPVTAKYVDFTNISKAIK